MSIGPKPSSTTTLIDGDPRALCGRTRRSDPRRPHRPATVRGRRRHRVGVKCLHAHSGMHLAGGDDPIGRWASTAYPRTRRGSTMRSCNHEPRFARHRHHRPLDRDHDDRRRLLDTPHGAGHARASASSNAPTARPPSSSRTPSASSPTTSTTSCVSRRSVVEAPAVALRGPHASAVGRVEIGLDRAAGRLPTPTRRRRRGVPHAGGRADRRARPQSRARPRHVET